jgi:hypothetical protein
MPVRRTVKAVLTEGAPPPRKLPDNFEFFSRIVLTRNGDTYEAFPVPFDRVAGKRSSGFHSGQAMMNSINSIQGGEIEVELNYDPAFI